nr:MAG TPA: hypothetical protein [Caudoviricetes sp.]
MSLPQYLTLIGAGLLICNWRFSQMAFSRVCFLSKLSKTQNRLMMSAFLYTCKAQVSSCMPLL